MIKKRQRHELVFLKGELMAIRESELIRANENERYALRKLEEMLNSEELNGDAANCALPKLVGADGETVELPPCALKALRQAVSYMTHGKDFSFVLYDRLLSTQDAADLLHMSRPTLIKVLEEGEIPYIMVGTHRRLQYDDIMAYKQRRHERQLQAIREIAR